MPATKLSIKVPAATQVKIDYLLTILRLCLRLLELLVFSSTMLHDAIDELLLFLAEVILGFLSGHWS